MSGNFGVELMKCGGERKEVSKFRERIDERFYSQRGSAWHADSRAMIDDTTKKGASGGLLH